MLTLEKIKLLLQDRNASHVARVTGLSVTTVCAIRNGETDNPTWNTVRILSEYFERGDDE
jgi:transcriptional regulator with XRE-family HTH domain